MERLFCVDGNYDIIRATDHFNFSNILDIGFGKGGASLYFASKNKSVTAIGKNPNYPREAFIKNNIHFKECSIEEFDTNERFDAVWASHILEHTANVSAALQKIRNLLNDDGWLFICVPPNKNYVVSGHISTGWNLGQLMLVLYFNGFNVKTGHFASHKYNICAFVQKAHAPRYHPDDGGIIALETVANDFPIDVFSNMDGDIPSINWFFEVDHQKFLIPAVLYNQALSRIRTLEHALETQTHQLQIERNRHRRLTAKNRRAPSKINFLHSIKNRIKKWLNKIFS